MSQESGGQSTQASGAEEPTTTDVKKDVVSYDTYQKVLNERKKDQERAKAAELKIQEYEHKKLEEAGKFQEVITDLRKRAEEKESAYETERKARIADKLTAMIREESSKHGVIDFEDMLKVGNLDSIQADPETGKVDPSTIKRYVEDLKAKKSYLFKATTVQTADATPNAGKAPGTLTAKDLSSMSTDELMKLALKVK
jgi:hypothetical protein